MAFMLVVKLSNGNSMEVQFTARIHTMKNEGMSKRLMMPLKDTTTVT